MVSFVKKKTHTAILVFLMDYVLDAFCNLSLALPESISMVAVVWKQRLGVDCHKLLGFSLLCPEFLDSYPVK